MVWVPGVVDPGADQIIGAQLVSNDPETVGGAERLSVRRDVRSYWIEVTGYLLALK